MPNDSYTDDKSAFTAHELLEHILAEFTKRDREREFKAAANGHVHRLAKAHYSLKQNLGLD